MNLTAAWVRRNMGRLVTVRAVFQKRVDGRVRVYQHRLLTRPFVGWVIGWRRLPLEFGVEMTEWTEDGFRGPELVSEMTAFARGSQPALVVSPWPTRRPHRGNAVCTPASPRRPRDWALKVSGEWWRVYSATGQDALELVKVPGDNGFWLNGEHYNAYSGTRWKPTREEWAVVAREHRLRKPEDRVDP